MQSRVSSSFVSQISVRVLSLSALNQALLIRLRFSGRDLPEVKEPEDVTDANDAFHKLQGAIYEYYQQVTPEGEPPFKSATTALLASEARADLLLSLSTDPPPAYESSRPLRLLSCGELQVCSGCSIRNFTDDFPFLWHRWWRGARSFYIAHFEADYGSSF